MPKDDIEKRIHSVGRNLPHQEVKIVDTSGCQTVPLGQVGEICFRGYHLMQGYFNDPEASSQVIDRHGWLHSGDLGVMDGDGYVSITGRLEEMITHGEENIYPREIEDFLIKHPKVAEVAVFGISDDVDGEELVAWIQLQANTDCSVEEIKAYSEANLAHFKIPKIIFFVDSFPMTVTGKLQKFRMREMTQIMLKSPQSRQNI
jgi:fatty-acyl-CoA synthase